MNRALRVSASGLGRSQRVSGAGLGKHGIFQRSRWNGMVRNRYTGDVEFDATVQDRRSQGEGQVTWFEIGRQPHVRFRAARDAWSEVIAPHGQTLVFLVPNTCRRAKSHEVIALDRSHDFGDRSAFRTIAPWSAAWDEWNTGKDGRSRKSAP